MKKLKGFDWTGLNLELSSDLRDLRSLLSTGTPLPAYTASLLPVNSRIELAANQLDECLKENGWFPSEAFPTLALFIEFEDVVSALYKSSHLDEKVFALIRSALSTASRSQFASPEKDSSKQALPQVERPLERATDKHRLAGLSLSLSTKLCQLRDNELVQRLITREQSSTQLSHEQFLLLSALIQDVCSAIRESVREVYLARQESEGNLLKGANALLAILSEHKELVSWLGQTRQLDLDTRAVLSFVEGPTSGTTDPRILDLIERSAQAIGVRLSQVL